MTLSCTHIGVSQPRCPQIDGTFSFQTKLLEREYCADFKFAKAFKLVLATSA